MYILRVVLNLIRSIENRIEQETQNRHIVEVLYEGFPVTWLHERASARQPGVLSCRIAPVRPLLLPSHTFFSEPCLRISTLARLVSAENCPIHRLRASRPSTHTCSTTRVDRQQQLPDPRELDSKITIFSSSSTSQETPSQRHTPALLQIAADEKTVAMRGSQDLCCVLKAIRCRSPVTPSHMLLSSSSCKRRSRLALTLTLPQGSLSV